MTQLLPGHNLTFERKPQLSPKKLSAKILIIGRGGTGLVTAWVLLDRGYHVVVMSKEWASFGKHQRLTSQVAGHSGN